jgi:hypothetical protein
MNYNSMIDSLLLHLLFIHYSKACDHLYAITLKLMKHYMSTQALLLDIVEALEIRFNE